MITEGDEMNKFADIAVKDSKDSGGLPYNMGFIGHCRKWRESCDTYAYRHYSSYLLDGCREDKLYRELKQLISSDFLAKKVLAIGSFFSVLEDVSCLIKAARTRGDMHQYGRSLRLHCELWERGVSGAEAGVAVVLARHGQFREAVANTVYSRSPKEAFDVLLSVMNVVDDNDIDAIQEVADALVECVKQMDNEGARAHHVHRILHAVRLRNADIALRMVPKCITVADAISDEFQRLVCSLFLVQQVAPLDLDLAEDISRGVTGAYFAGEEGQTLLALAALGRGAELSERRIARLNRLLQRAERLSNARDRLATDSELLLELLWEESHIELLHRWVEVVAKNISDVEDSYVSDAVSALLYAEPILVNHAASPYHSGGEIGSMSARRLSEAIGLLHEPSGDVSDFLYDVFDLLLARVCQIEDASDRQKTLTNTVDSFCRLASDLGGPLGNALLDHLETSSAMWEDKSDAYACLVRVATTWYDLGAIKRGERGLLNGVEYVKQCKTQLAELDGNSVDRSRSGSLNDLFGAFDDLEAKFSGEYEETAEDVIKEGQERLTMRLASALSEIPTEYRVSAFKKMRCILEVGDEDVTLGQWIEPVVRSLAEVHRRLALSVVKKTRGRLQRCRAVFAVTRGVGANSPNRPAQIVGLFAAQARSERAMKLLRRVPWPRRYLLSGSCYQGLLAANSRG